MTRNHRVRPVNMLFTPRVDHLASNLASAALGDAKLRANAQADQIEQDKKDVPTNLSKRGQENIDHGKAMEKLMAIFSNLYNKETNPNGIISLGVAENSLMHEDVVKFLDENLRLTPWHLTYCEGPGGTTRLRTALSKLFNDHFNPYIPVKPDQLVVSAGAGAIIDELVFATCDEGDGILVARPLYMGFLHDLTTRSRVKLIPVSLDGVDPMGPEAAQRFDEEVTRQMADGVKIRGMIFCNPHNPLGKCYSVESIKGYLRFCQKHQIHFYSDEIYALSIYESNENKDATPFTSVLSLNLDGLVDKHLVHVIYGMSKDFCANGLRAGVLLSQSNPDVLKASRSAGLFAWTSSLTDLAWSLILEDKKYLTYHIEKNQKLLGQRFELLIDFLQKHDIPYITGSNAGFFIWVDFNKFLRKKSSKMNGVISNGSIVMSDMGVAHPDPVLEKLDAKLFQRLIKGGLYFATSPAFFGEHYGWYRISFSESEEIIKLGLVRLEKILSNITYIEEEDEDEDEENRLRKDPSIDETQFTSVITSAT